VQKTEKITVRLTRDQIDTLSIIVKQENVGSISEAIRASVQEFIRNHSAPLIGEIIGVKFPKEDVRKLNTIIECGDFLSAQELIRVAVKEYVDKRLDRILETGTTMEDVEKRRMLHEEEESKISEYVKK
jgi:Arc/MetJ-type ribon-helix-helix transcriptional regulator